MKLTAPGDRRLTKGAIIGAAGLALLVGGGTFALWFDNEDIPGGTVNSGELDLELTGAGAGGAGVWHAETCTGTVIPIIADYLISPGDIVCIAQPMDVTVTGADIAATFSINTAAATGPLAGVVTITTSLTPATGFTDAGANTLDRRAECHGAFDHGERHVHVPGDHRWTDCPALVDRPQPDRFSLDQTAND